MSQNICSATFRDSTDSSVPMGARINPHICSDTRFTFGKGALSLRATDLEFDDNTTEGVARANVTPKHIFSSGVPVFGTQYGDQTTYQVKATKCGRTMLNVVRYQRPHVYTEKRTATRVPRDVLRSGGAERRADNVKRARATLTQLVHTNWPHWTHAYSTPVFVTLTFRRDGEYADIAHKDNHKEQMKLLRRYHQEMRKMFGDLRYVWVKELHKDGEHVHFHILYFNLGFNTHEQMDKAWPHGYVRTERIRTGKKGIAKCAGYLAKYMGKNTPDKNERKLYRPSHNLEYPTTYYAPYDVHALLLDWQHVRPVRTIKQNPYTGEYIVYERYIDPDVLPDTEKPPFQEVSVQVAL